MDKRKTTIPNERYECFLIVIMELIHSMTIFTPSSDDRLPQNLANANVFTKKKTPRVSWRSLGDQGILEGFRQF